MSEKERNLVFMALKREVDSSIKKLKKDIELKKQFYYLIKD